MCKMLMDFIPGINPDIFNSYHDISMIFPMTYYSMIDLIIIDGSMTFTLKRELTYSRFKGSWVPMIFPFPQGGICCLTASGLRAGLPSLCGFGGASSTLTLGRTGRRQTQAVWSVGWMERQIKWVGVGVTVIQPLYCTVYINPYQNALMEFYMWPTYEVRLSKQAKDEQEKTPQNLVWVTAWKSFWMHWVGVIATRETPGWWNRWTWTSTRWMAAATCAMSASWGAKWDDPHEA